MIDGARYVHTNLIARDWRALAGFYESVFGCTPVPPERDLSGPDLAAGTALPGAALRGAHLRLPGSADGPTLEIFTYTELAEGVPAEVNRPGFGHIAFAVPDVEAAHALVLANGGTPLGEIVTTRVGEGFDVQWCYVRDPEGNIIELQTRRSAAAR